MFYKSSISNINDQEILYLFFQNNYEFSNEFNNNGIIKKNIIDNVKNYIINNNISFSGNSIYLVSQGIIFGTIKLDNELVNTHIPIPEKLEIIDII